MSAVEPLEPRLHGPMHSKLVATFWPVRNRPEVTSSVQSNDTGLGSGRSITSVASHAVSLAWDLIAVSCGVGVSSCMSRRSAYYKSIAQVLQLTGTRDARKVEMESRFPPRDGVHAARDLLRLIYLWSTLTPQTLYRQTVAKRCIDTAKVHLMSA